ncbi:MAG TPA: hypothetical protein VLZ28_07945 [Daejeonella sp.]|nr:hypothetical protein [Daejeonella sp.]
MKLFAIVLLAMGMLLVSCDKKKPIVENVSGVMKISATGACRVLIQLNNGLSLFPTNPDKVQTFLTDGRQVTISYRPDNEFVSPCTGSEPAIIEDIR